MNIRMLGNIGVISLIGCFGIGVTQLYFNQMKLSQQLHELRLEKKEVVRPQSITIEEAGEVHPWAQIQVKARDTVVQVFSQVAVQDLLEPYKTPMQGQSFGSGFFINDTGEIVTNAHVVANARSVWIQVPSLGKRIIDVTIIGVCPERDLALLRVTTEGYKMIHDALGKIPFLALGDSDRVLRADEILALGYPLAQHALKSTAGVVSGREQLDGQYFIQMSAAVNPGSSGGPSLNRWGEVIGINSAIIQNAQNVGYVIPINELKIILDDIRKVTFLRKPFLGINYVSGSEALTNYLGNPLPGGCYVFETYKRSLLEKAGVMAGDMIYQIDEYPIDMYGEMVVPWSEDKISIASYVSRLKLGQEIRIVVYREGTKKIFSIKFDLPELLPIRVVYPEYEPLDYEVVGGLVIMPLTLNHLAIFLSAARGLAKYAETKEQQEPALIITNIFPDSQAHRTRALSVGSIITEVNGMEVKTLQDLRAAVRKGKDDQFLTIKTASQIFVAIPWDRVLKEESRFARDYHYPITDTMRELITHYEGHSKKAIA